MKSTDISTVLKKVPDLPAADVTSAFKMFMEYKKESETTKREIAKIDAVKEVLIHDINKKYDFYHKLFNQVFDERRGAINKFFEVIDRGMKENNYELITAGLSGLSNIVASSPFSNIAELGRLIESGQKIDL